ncbi:hypothetical protein HNY73_021770 [Argiope bruennichi]|uniref:Uncharacterized protein n=1 Tax=Argiope bruennichi TaxID=94029 RepID=A0A8T0E040_ARGBR|nr:hypothetical protein HNY73_021770 [Argiope bruennichi]
MPSAQCQFPSNYTSFVLCIDISHQKHTNKMLNKGINKGRDFDPCRVGPDYLTEHGHHGRSMPFNIILHEKQRNQQGRRDFDQCERPSAMFSSTPTPVRYGPIKLSQKTHIKSRLNKGINKRREISTHDEAAAPSPVPSHGTRWVYASTSLTRTHINTMLIIGQQWSPDEISIHDERERPASRAT